jgi:nucleotide-binding universal stress UspA family protein
MGVTGKERPAPGRVVVGVDGSARSAAALRWAAAEAELRDCPLVVVYAWQVASEPTPHGHVSGGAAPLAAYQEAAQARTERFVSDVLGGTAGRTVAVHAPHHMPVRALLDAVGGADLLVVGSPARGRVAAAVLGSVVEQAVRHAPCPVVVVPADPAEMAAAAPADR